MKNTYITFLLLFFLSNFSWANKEFLQLDSQNQSNRNPRNYYISNEGNDNNEGTKNSPWSSLSKASQTTLIAGDSLLFKRGDRFDGHLVINGSGTESNPIVVSSYGEGELPIITGQVGDAGGGDYQEALLVENQSHIELSYLEINNERTSNRTGVKEDDAYGILITNTGTKSTRGYYIHHLTVRNVYAPKPILPDEGEDAFNSLEVSGIRFLSAKNRIAGQEKNMSDILVEECYFTDIQRLGIHIKHEGGQNGIGNDRTNTNSDILVRNNEFYYTGGTCVLPIKTYNTLIENNIFDHPGANVDERMPGRGSAVWTWRCFNTVIQKNQCLSTRGYLDSHGVHIDHENVNTFVQYNYMEDCEGGFVEILGGNVNSVYRFNVSVNDGWRNNPNWRNSNHTLWINENVPSGTHYSDSNYIYNNTVYMDRNFNTAIDIDAKATYIFNNIFYSSEGTIGGKQCVVKTNNNDYLLSNNLFYGKINSKFSNVDNNKIVEDPQFINPGTDDQNGYHLQDDSPAVNAGLQMVGPPIPEAGTGVFKDLTPYPTEDYYGNPIDLINGTPNIGASNLKDIPVSSVTIEDKITLGINETYTLTYTVLPNNATNKNVTWSVENNEVVNITEEGLVTALTIGETTITVTTEDGNKTAICQVNIIEESIPVPTNIIVTPAINEALIEWESIESADSFYLEYKLLESEWIRFTDITSNSYTISDLSANMEYQVRLKTVIDDFTSLWSENISFTTLKDDVINSIKNEEQFIALSPNPVENKLHIQAHIQATVITIYDVFGRTYIQQNYSSTIDVSVLPQGLYLLKVDQLKPVRFIKK